MLHDCPVGPIDDVERDEGEREDDEEGRVDGGDPLALDVGRGSSRIGTGNTVFIRIVANFEMLTTSQYIDNGTISGLNNYPDNFTK